MTAPLTAIPLPATVDATLALLTGRTMSLNADWPRRFFSH
jgi:hypothetical protein